MISGAYCVQIDCKTVNTIVMSEMLCQVAVNMFLVCYANMFPLGKAPIFPVILMGYNYVFSVITLNVWTYILMII